jgi:hypothetical protein
MAVIQEIKSTLVAVGCMRLSGRTACAIIYE